LLSVHRGLILSAKRRVLSLKEDSAIGYARLAEKVIPPVGQALIGKGANRHVGAARFGALLHLSGRSTQLNHLIAQVP
jgi:hypothetical protein